MAVLGVKDNTLPQISLTQSQTFVMPQDGNVCIHVIGAGGSGTSNTGQAFSGAAGGYCKKNSLAVTKGGSFTVVVGVGGPRGSGTSDGGNSTVAGPGLSATLTANGGDGGKSSGNAGGTAANGDVNNTGGVGLTGDRGGGGAVGIYGTGAAGIQYKQGGDSDAQGGESGFGHIGGGGKGGIMAYAYNGNSTFENGNSLDASGPFAGGGAIEANSATSSMCGGNGGTGGGGGGCRNNGIRTSGAGGDGLVLIQYLPS